MISTPIDVISRSVRSFYLEGILIAKGVTQVPHYKLARWVSANRDSEMLKFLHWGGGMKTLFPEGHELYDFEVEKAPPIGGHERGARGL